MLEHLYADLYLDRFNERNDRRLVAMVDITAAREAGDEVVLELTDRRTGAVTELRRDLVFLGTGFSQDDVAAQVGGAQRLGVQPLGCPAEQGHA